MESRFLRLILLLSAIRRARHMKSALAYFHAGGALHGDPRRVHLSSSWSWKQSRTNTWSVEVVVMIGTRVARRRRNRMMLRCCRERQWGGCIVVRVGGCRGAVACGGQIAVALPRNGRTVAYNKHCQTTPPEFGTKLLQRSMLHFAQQRRGSCSSRSVAVCGAPWNRGYRGHDAIPRGALHRI